MKKILLLVFIILSSVSAIAKYNYVKCDVDILNVRVDANTTSKVIDVVKKGDIAKVVNVSKESMIIDSVKAKWFKIETKNNLIGWVFSGYLSSVDGKIIPFGVNNIIGEWMIGDNDGIGEVKFSFFKNGKLIIKGINSKAYDAECKWVYHSDIDSIEIVFISDKKKWDESIKNNLLKRLKNCEYEKKEYLEVDDVNARLVIKLSRNYYNESKKCYELVSFTFFGYNVAKNMM